MKSGEILWDIMWGLKGMLREDDVTLEKADAKMHHIQNYKGSNSAKTFARIKMHNSKQDMQTQTCKCDEEIQCLKKSVEKKVNKLN